MTQRVGTWSLTQWVRPGRNGECVTFGEFDSYRQAVEAARTFAPHSKLEGGFSARFLRSESGEGLMTDGIWRTIELDGPAGYDPDVELRLSTGRVVWLSDLEAELNARPEAVGDTVFVITSDGSGSLSVEDGYGKQLATGSNFSEDHEQFAGNVHRLVLEALRNAAVRV